MSRERETSLRFGSVPPDVCRAFGVDGPAERLAGGQGQAFRVGDLVLKPVENPDRYEWACRLINTVDNPAFRVSRPRIDGSGNYAFLGWGATAYEPGREVRGNWTQKLCVCRAFHESLRSTSRDTMPPASDLWSVGNDIAWEEAALPGDLDAEIQARLHALFERRRSLARPTSIMHGDMCGNILFDDNLPPLVIDFSPGVGDVRFASAILVADAIAWEGAPVDLTFELGLPAEESSQLLLRAVLFRLVVAALFRPRDAASFHAEWNNFSPVIDQL